MTKRESIIQAVLAALVTVDGLSTDNVFRWRTDAFLQAESGSVLVTWGPDQPAYAANSVLNWSLPIRISIMQRGDSPDSSADDLVSAVYNKLMTDAGISAFDMDFQVGNHEAQLLDTNKTAAVITLNFIAFYRTKLNDLTE